jgi:hypothetical protein
MSELNAAMLQEFMAVTAGANQPLSAMMDPASNIQQQLMTVWKKYEPEMNQLQAELAPYSGAPPVMAPPFAAQASPSGSFHGAGPGGFPPPQVNQQPSESESEQAEP